LGVFFGKAAQSPDFSLVSRRALGEEEYRLFRYHFLLGADWKLCTRKLGVDRGNFFHAIYKIEQKLGLVFRELEPYGLFPLDEYFHGPSRVIAPPRKVPLLERIIPPHLMFPPIGRTA
jgi:hypothetical protein